ncbi:MAG: hypothetical protein R3B13_37315 [Polyangiaceae bacterium]
MARRADRKWTAIVAAAERSGRAHTQIAKQHGVTVAALKYHIYKSRREGHGSGVQVLPVRTDEDAVALTARFGAVTLQFHHDASAEFIAGVVRALSEPAC